MARALGFPFTSAQLKELERQEMIYYKYMMASVPVPPHLLLPIIASSHSSSSLVDNGSIFNLNQLRFCNNGGKDAEPGRCKRTDGKKWRCSRDVAPQQKYCERHMHKSRASRSRKPVEVHQNHHSFTTATATAAANNKTTTRLLHHHSLPQTTISSPHELLRSTIQQPKSGHQSISACSYKEPNRGLDWTMEGEMLSKQQQWQHLLQTNIASVFQQECIEESLNLIPYADFSAHQNDDCNFFLNPDLLCLKKHSQMETPRGFIDAWSNENPNPTTTATTESSVSSHGNLSPSSLTLSMATAAAGTALNDEMGQIQMGLGVRDSDHHEPQVSSWLSPVSWVCSTAPGGPLAEVLRPSSVAVSSDPASPYACNCDSISTPATRVSSPEGTMLSLSDGHGGCKSPAIAAASTAATPEIMPFPWLS